jgi:hypothetical protein
MIWEGQSVRRWRDWCECLRGVPAQEHQSWSALILRRALRYRHAIINANSRNTAFSVKSLLLLSLVILDTRLLGLLKFAATRWRSRRCSMNMSTSRVLPRVPFVYFACAIVCTLLLVRDLCKLSSSSSVTPTIWSDLKQGLPTPFRSGLLRFPPSQGPWKGTYTVVELYWEPELGPLPVLMTIADSGAITSGSLVAVAWATMSPKA